MTRWLNQLLAGLAALGAAVALIFRASAKRHQAEATRQRDRADHAEARATTRQRVEQARDDIRTQHQEEDRDAQARLDAGRRDHLDGDW